MTLATHEESVLYMVICNSMHICCQVSAEGGSGNHLPGKAKDPDLLSESLTYSRTSSLSLEGTYQICWNLDIFSFEFMSIEVMDSYCETVFNFAQRHKKHNLIGFQTKETEKEWELYWWVVHNCFEVMLLAFFEMWHWSNCTIRAGKASCKRFQWMFCSVYLIYWMRCKLHLTYFLKD